MKCAKFVLMLFVCSCSHINQVCIFFFVCVCLCLWLKYIYVKKELINSIVIAVVDVVVIAVRVPSIKPCQSCKSASWRSKIKPKT